MSVESRDGFDHVLEQQLRTHAAGHRGPSPLPSQARYNASYVPAGRQVSIFAKAAALASTKATMGLIVAAAAVGAAGAGEAAITGSGNPADWGARLAQQAQKCTTALMPGSHDNGGCLNTFEPQPDKQPTTNVPVNGSNPTPSAPAGHSGAEPTAHPSGKPTSSPGSPFGPGGPPTTQRDKPKPSPPAKGPDKVKPTPTPHGHPPGKP
jgi:hypothetical protein